MSSFRFQARYGLFTYSQCGQLRPSAVLELFTSLSADCIIGREAHGDGGTHLHAFVDFRRKYRTRDVRKFDVEGFHPNIISTIRSPSGSWDYATKDGDICGGSLRRPEPSQGSNAERQNAGWDQLRDASTREEFFELASTHLFSHLVKSFTSFSAYADWKFRVDRSPYCHPSQYSFDLTQYGELREWVGRHLSGNQIGSRLFVCNIRRHPRRFQILPSIQELVGSTDRVLLYRQVQEEEAHCMG
uniref:Replication-associated protein n=1 Tax=Grus japonensis Genomoviridae sp. TaxID=2814961 RepID=A0A8E7G204_9VIRU